MDHGRIHEPPPPLLHRQAPPTSTALDSIDFLNLSSSPPLARLHPSPSSRSSHSGSRSAHGNGRGSAHGSSHGSSHSGGTLLAEIRGHAPPLSLEPNPFEYSFARQLERQSTAARREDVPSTTAPTTLPPVLPPLGPPPLTTSYQQAVSTIPAAIPHSRPVSSPYVIIPRVPPLPPRTHPPTAVPDTRTTSETATTTNTTTTTTTTAARKRLRKAATPVDPSAAESQRQAALERNRQAAKVSRERKKAKIAELQERHAFYTDDNRRLQEEDAELEREMQRLRQLLEAAHSCPIFQQNIRENPEEQHNNSQEHL